MAFELDDYCFACGKKNERGLRLNVETMEGSSRATINFPRYMQGYNGIVHGGLVATVLDELAVYAGVSLGRQYATGEIKIRYKKPVRTGYEYIVEGKVIEDKDKVVTAESILRDSEHVIYAQARAKLIRVHG